MPALPLPHGFDLQASHSRALSGRKWNYLSDCQKGEGPLSYDELEDALFKNRTKLGMSLSDARFTAKLRVDYEKSLVMLSPIKQRLARTDRLIDLIGYRLYGLTEEEVAVVEGER